MTAPVLGAGLIGTPLELSSPFLMPQQPDLCAPTLWLANFVVPLDPRPIASDESEPTPTPPWTTPQGHNETPAIQDSAPILVTPVYVRES